jgi:glutathione peroxidase
MLKIRVSGSFNFNYRRNRGGLPLGFIFNPSPSAPPAEKSMYEFTLKDIDGKDVKLDAYKGKAVMIVNTASKCGLTPQYEGLQKIYDRYKDQGFVVLGFPANNFMGQNREPKRNQGILHFEIRRYFPMFSKISVKGADQHPFYTFLTNKESNPDSTATLRGTLKSF